MKQLNLKVYFFGDDEVVIVEGLIYGQGWNELWFGDKLFEEKCYCEIYDGFVIVSNQVGLFGDLIQFVIFFSVIYCGVIVIYCGVKVIYCGFKVIYCGVSVD